jgi:hypothetical protein
VAQRTVVVSVIDDDALEEFESRDVIRLS